MDMMLGVMKTTREFSIRTTLPRRENRIANRDVRLSQRRRYRAYEASRGNPGNINCAEPQGSRTN
jgi:hypothetical protein